MCSRVAQNIDVLFWDSQSKLAENPDDAALNLYIGCGHNDGTHFRIRRLQTNFPARLAVKAFQRGFVIADQCHNDFAGIGNLRRLDDHVIAI
jgi:hypothetical protein